ncbi:MAG TPA: D-alanyl-D-alanine carboxypeptidase [Hyphomicrobiaceae bacterium]|jgi:D-alanyl-D-alanine carboxypeptidase|nr:D-alanyl-D-alanine carboxypeptidase [Hyphomicrobiaceae bacterium]
MTLPTQWRRPWRRLGIAAVALAVAVNALALPAYAQVNGRHAVLIVDANTGRVIHQSSADEPRYPASLAKLMTLYLVFELIEQGRLSYGTKIRFSANAVAAQPSKLGVEEGTEITLLEAIKALITKSCNDVAVALAEHIAGSEVRFARMMTQKARQLGMRATTFQNASGLPDPEQVTTARDMITLALRLQDNFPRHYPLFATRTFTYNGTTFRNHNTMLFSYEGSDGLKTGYTRASGFNLVASVRRGRKHVVGAVFGGATASQRNAAMRSYLNIGLMKASEEKTRRPAPMLIARAKSPPAILAAPAPQPAQRPAPREASPPVVEMARVRPVLVPGAPHLLQHPVVPPAADNIAALLARAENAQAPQQPLTTASAPPRPAAAAGAFHIQIGAFQSQTEAERQLASIRQRAGSLLSDRSAVTSAVKQGDKVFYRARYAGFDAQTTAAGACAELKRLSIDCLVMKAE